jgi:tRNA(Ile)-lysidine synthase
LLKSDHKTLLQELDNHIAKHLPFLKGKKLLIACSGGVDSVVLTHLLHKLGFSIAIAHCNFSLRGKESNEDEEFVLNLAKKLEIAVFSETFDTKAYAREHKLSTQLAARELRYRWFEEILKDFKYDFLLTAHHADDDLETFLINLSRGTGLRGLTGIPMINDLIVRPLLCFGRDEIVSFAKRNNLYWREDSSNAKADYLRNKLRLEVIPRYKEAAKGLLQSFQKTRAHLEDSQHLIDDYMALVYNLVISEVSEGYQINIQKLQELPNTDALVYELLSPFGFTDFSALSDLLSAQSGKQIFSKTHRLLKDRYLLLLTDITVPKSTEDEIEVLFISENEKKIDKPIKLEFQAVKKIGNITNSAVYVDKDKIHFPLQLRRWREGDIFQPFGMQGKKKLSKFFKDEKLSLVAKEKIWVLCSHNEIVWIVNYRLDDRFKVDANTKHILKISTSL